MPTDKYKVPANKTNKLKYNIRKPNCGWCKTEVNTLIANDLTGAFADTKNKKIKIGRQCPFKN